MSRAPETTRQAHELKRATRSSTHRPNVVGKRSPRLGSSREIVTRECAILSEGNSPGVSVVLMRRLSRHAHKLYLADYVVV